MTVTFIHNGYAYAPKLGERPIFSVDLEIDGKARHFEVPAWNTFEARYAVSQQLGIPFSTN
jgi:hypothetical protein